MLADAVMFPAVVGDQQDFQVHSAAVSQTLFNYSCAVMILSYIPAGLFVHINGHRMFSLSVLMVI